MKGPFGLLLIGGGIILVVGLFTGKITFPGSTATTSGATAVPGVTINPSGTSVKPIVKSGKKTCPTGFVMGSDGNCYVSTG